ncbi:hypothetical protein C8R44DRAFT_742289 [Mycena epipterygia]|nr:hypothetical protein C8R44DRAFT_742289 [Mycena epipterygia]
MAPKDASRSLTVSIVGAGIGGLAAAISLRRNGHHIKADVVPSDLRNIPHKAEIGAVVGLPVNALRVLQCFGFSRGNVKGCHYDGAIVLDAENGVGVTRPWLVPRPDEDHDLICHRRDLHDELRRLALGEGDGPPTQLHLDSKVVVCDPEARTVTLSGGEIIHADVVIGADGIHIQARTSQTGIGKEILEEFRDFHPKSLRILDLPVTTPILKWQLRAIPLLPTWIRGRAALLGDSAHATLPQGAAMAIEEAGALGSLFPLGTIREETLGKERGEFFNTESVTQAVIPSKRGHYLRSREMQASIVEYDAIQVPQEYYDAHFSLGTKV